MRHLGRAAVAVLLTAVAVAGPVAPASAHNQLIASTPANKAELATGPATVELTFDQPVQDGPDLNSIVVVGPGGTDQWQGGGVTVRGNVASAPVRELGPAGEYRVGYRILSADGHPVSGEVTFILTAPGNGSPAPAPDATAPGGTASEEGSGGVPIWVWIGGAAVLLAAGVAVAMRAGGGKAA